MRSYAAAFMMALVLSAIVTPVMRRIAFRCGAVSSPGGRNVNEQRVPRLGGIAIAISVLAPLMTLFVVESGVAHAVRENASKAIGLFVGGLLLCGVGALDDMRGVRAPQKLLVQVIAAIVAFGCGFRIDAVLLPYIGPASMGAFALPVTVLWIVGITNAVNLIDGLDGLAAGVVFFAAVTNFSVALLGGQQLGHVVIALLMASLMGSLLGFLFYNFNPARIFMGDSGSYFLGFLLATSSLLAPMQKTSTTVALLVPMVALGIPIFDTLFSMVRRILERRPIFSPDRGHIHHRLLDMGITHRRAVLTLYGVSVVLAGAAMAIALGRDWAVGVALVLATVVMVSLVRSLGYFQHVQWRHRRKARFYQDEIEGLRKVVPQALQRLRRTRATDEVFAELRWFAEHGGLAGIRLDDHEGRTRFAWHSDDDSAGRGVELSEEFPLSGVERAQLTFNFAHSIDVGLDAPRAEVLLQLVVDQSYESLLKVGCPWLTSAKQTIDGGFERSSATGAQQHRMSHETG